MRLLILSDLHVDAHRAAARHHGCEASPWPPLPLEGVDAVLCAGDVANGPEGLAELAPRCRGVPLIAVAGNHEYYAGPADTGAVQARLQVLSDAGVLHWLERRSLLLDGLRILGTTLWTDFALYGDAGAGMAACAVVMQDFRGAIRQAGRRLEPADTLAWHRRDRDWLAAELARPFPGPTVVLTHHAPHPDCIEPFYAGDPVSTGFASDLSALFDGRIALWVHGHCHRATDLRVGATRIVSNPRGYPDEPAAQTGFEPGRIIDLPAAAG